jgi:tetratricopeptide (TPR) repeat protein/tRNA A-37 threonylcarbamoyl transferase component Bud32
MTAPPPDDEKVPPEKAVAPQEKTAFRPGSFSESFNDRATHEITQTRAGEPRTPEIPPAFLAGQVVAARYEIVRFIAQGGMGEVYEARDRKLLGTVALKTIRTDVAGRAKAVDRFLREVHIARRVTHPNVCRIFDVDEHHWPASEGSGETRPPVNFLTMELLGGENLADRIERGRLDRTEALDIVSQVAAGLDAAHALGIVHRDFKSANVMLVPSSGSQARTRVVITDFGLARGVEGDNPLASISETGLVVGTAAYMAPEQVEGKPLTAAADLYALGVVMYEMVTGERPFSGGSAMSVAVKRLQSAPPSPRIHVADLDPAWESAILRCLERDPADRFASAADLVKALGGFEVAAGSGSATLQRRRSKRNRWLIAGVGAILGLAWGVFWTVSRWRPPATVTPRVASPASPASAVAAPAGTPRRSLAILGLGNATAKPSVAWLATALPEMLSSELTAGEGLRLVPPSDVVRARKELDLGADPLGLSTEALARLGRNLGAELLGVGSYTLVGEGDSSLLRVDLRIMSAASGEILATSTSTGTQGQLFDLVSRAGGSLRQKLGLADVSPVQALQVEASLPSNPEGARLYAEGLSQLRAANAVAAKDTLQQAIAADPKHPLPHSALAAAWSALGYEGKAKEEAKVAAASAAALPPSDRLLMEARFHEAEKDWTKATSSYKDLWTRFPDSLDFGLLLADVQTSGGRAKEALVTLEALRKVPAGNDDPRVDLAAARAEKALGNNQGSRAAAAKAAAQGAVRGMRLLESRARLHEAVALVDLGDRASATAAAEAARGLAEAAGDKDWTARSLEQLAGTLERGGDLDGALRLYGRALKIHREVGNLLGVARVLACFGRLHQKQGHPRESDAAYEEALATFRKVGAKHEMAPMLNNLGAKLQIEGDLPGAQRRYQEALALFGEVGDKTGLAATLTNLGEILFARGELKQAQDMHQESLATNREIGDKAGQGYDLYRLGEVSSARGDLKVAREKYVAALALLQEAGDRLTTGEVNLSVAHLDLAEGQAASAEGLARNSEEVFRAEGATDREAVAEVLLADALLAQKKTAEAREAAGQARALAEKSKERRARWGAARAAARVRAATGSPVDQAAAVASLDSAAAEAAKAGYVGVNLELRLAAGQIEKAAGRAPSARARLRLVAKEAAAKGFSLIGRQASS